MSPVNTCCTTLTDYCHMLVPYNTYSQFFHFYIFFQFMLYHSWSEAIKTGCRCSIYNSNLKKKTLLVLLSAAKQQNDILTEQPTHPNSPPTPDIFFPQNKEKVNRLKLLTLTHIALDNVKAFFWSHFLCNVLKSYPMPSCTSCISSLELPRQNTVDWVT